MLLSWGMDYQEQEEVCVCVEGRGEGCAVSTRVIHTMRCNHMIVGSVRDGSRGVRDEEGCEGWRIVSDGQMSEMEKCEGWRDVGNLTLIESSCGLSVWSCVWWLTTKIDQLLHFHILHDAVVPCLCV